MKFWKYTAALLPCLVTISRGSPVSAERYCEINHLSFMIGAFYNILILVSVACVLGLLIECALSLILSNLRTSHGVDALVKSMMNTISVFILSLSKYIYNDTISKFLSQNTAFAQILNTLNHSAIKDNILIMSTICAYLSIYQFCMTLFDDIIKKTRIRLLSKVLLILCIGRFLLISEIYPNTELYIPTINIVILAIIAFLVFEFVLLSRKILSLSTFRHVRYMYAFISLILTAMHMLQMRKYDSVGIMKLILLWCIPQVIIYAQHRLQRYMYSYIRHRFQQVRLPLTRMNLIRFTLLCHHLLQYAAAISMMIIGASITSNFIISQLLAKKYLILKLLYLTLAILAHYFATFVIEYIFTQYSENASLKMPFDSQRIRTFSNLSKTVFHGLSWLVCILVILFIFGVSIAPFFQSIGLFSAAISLSVQQFIRDIVNGILILYDRTIQLNDIIEIDGKTSIVENMSLRYIRVRYDDGTLCTIPFHQISTIKNRNRQYTAAILNIAINSTIPVDKTENAIRDAFAILKDKVEMRRLVRSMELRDMVDFTSFAYIMQVKISATQSNHNRVKRAFMRVLHEVFLEREISIAKPDGSNFAAVPSASTLSPYTDFE